MALHKQERVRCAEQLLAEEQGKDVQIKQLRKELRAKDRQIEGLRRQLNAREEYAQELEAEMQRKYEQIFRRDKKLASQQTQLQTLRKRLFTQATELTRLRGSQQRDYEGGARKETPFQLTWRCGPDMPFEMSVYIQSVVVKDKLYIGGGYTKIDDNDYLVMEYGISSGKWITLPPYGTRYFAMAAVSNQLVLVGGDECDGDDSDVLGVWRADYKAWTHPYPDMPTARSFCSAVVWNEWLVVAGGKVGKECVSCVEVLNTISKQWYIGHPTPAPWTHMKSIAEKGMAYFMGGLVNKRAAATKVYFVGIGTLISSEGDGEIWKEIPALQLTYSTPLSISGCLLTAGGMDKYGKVVTAIHLYQPDSGKWVKVGDLPSPRYNCTCAVTTDKRLLVAGGWNGDHMLKRIDLATYL